MWGSNTPNLKRPNQEAELIVGKLPKFYQAVLQLRAYTDRPGPGLVIWHLNIRGLWSKRRYLEHAICSARQRPDIIALCETHIYENGHPPDIRGYKHYCNNFTSRSGGTAIYYKLFSKAEQLHHPANTNRELLSRITMAKINGV